MLSLTKRNIGVLLMPGFAEPCDLLEKFSVSDCAEKGADGFFFIREDGSTPSPVKLMVADEGVRSLMTAINPHVGARYVAAAGRSEVPSKNVLLSEKPVGK